MERKMMRKWAVLEMEIIQYLINTGNEPTTAVKLYQLWSNKHSYSTISQALRNLFYMNVLGKSSTPKGIGRFYAIRDRNDPLVKDALFTWAIYEEKLIKSPQFPEKEVDDFLQEFKDGKPEENKVKESEKK